MADEKKTAEQTADEAAEKAKKDREEQVAEQDNPPQPYPTPEQLNKQKAEGGPIDEEDGDEPATKADAAAKKKADDEAKAKAEADAKAKQSAGYPNRSL